MNYINQMDPKGSESEQEDSLFKKFSFESEYSYHQEVDELSSYNNSNNSLFLNKKTKPSINEITYDLGKTKDTKKDLEICNVISIQIIGRKINEGAQGIKIDKETQTIRPYYSDDDE